MGEASIRTTSSFKSRRNKIRLAYFGIAALWGFIVGVSALLVVLNQAGRPLAMSSPVYGILVVAGIVALTGGLLAAMLYREQVRNRKR